MCGRIGAKERERKERERDKCVSKEEGAEEKTV